MCVARSELVIKESRKSAPGQSVTSRGLPVYLKTGVRLHKNLVRARLDRALRPGGCPCT